MKPDSSPHRTSTNQSDFPIKTRNDSLVDSIRGITLARVSGKEVDSIMECNHRFHIEAAFTFLPQRVRHT